MRVISPAKVDNAKVLDLIAENYPDIKKYVPSIRNANFRYLRQRGNPGSLQSINLPKEAKDNLEMVYGTEAKKNNLSWIATYRKAKNFSHCPLCGNDGPTQLEHYLPQAHYAEHTIFSWNLIPTCGMCNLKRGKHANAPGEPLPLIHPYFDSEIINRGVLSVEFVLPYEAIGFVPKICEPEGMPLTPELLNRLKRQIARCIDNERFETSLNSKWNIWRGKVGKFKNAQELKADLTRDLRATVGPTGANSWESAFLRGLLADTNAMHWLYKNPIEL